MAYSWVMLTSSRLARTALIGLVALSLVGCSVIEDISRTGGSIVNGASIDSALAGAKERIESIDGVEFVDSVSTLQADYGYEVGIEVEVSEPSAASTKAIAQVVIETYGIPAFEDVPRTLAVTYNDGEWLLSLGTFDLTPETLQAEIDYQFTIGAAAGGQFSLSIYPDDYSAGYYRALSSPTADPRDFADLSSIADPTQAVFSGWSIPGISWYGDWPSRDAFDALATMKQLDPPIEMSRFPNTSGVSFDWLNPSQQLIVSYFAEATDGNPLADSSTRQSFDDVVSVLASTNLSVVAIQLKDFSGVPFAAIASGQCAMTVEPTADDLGLYNSLTRVPKGMVAGNCYG